MKKLTLPSFTGKKILITGGCGFLGSNLTRRLIAQGASVSVFVRKGKDCSNLIKDIQKKIKIIEGDLLREEDTIKAITGQDYLFHLAWQTDLKQSMQHPQQDLQKDGIALLNLLEACRKHNPSIKIIFTSTVTVIGMPEKIPSNESEKLNPLSIYDVHKILGEFYLSMYHQAYGLKTVVLRLANVFGEYQSIDNPNRGVLNFMIGKALKGEPMTVYGKGDFIRDYSYVQNIVDAFLLAAASEKVNGQTFVLGSGKGLTFNEVVNTIKKLTKGITGRDAVITHVPFQGDEHSINKRNFVSDSRKFSKLTGWYPQISFEEGLRRTIDFYYRQKG
ncbi:GDP-mannose 4,6-dehydratase [Candidatus Woesearchaeota archaeon]|nr:GDP-mannose 4,6-dehydratase [Candidatus Woesearchaeota archaeon]